MKLLLIYPPFCTPSTMPYSIAYLKSFVKSHLDIEVKCLDLNAKFNKLRFEEAYLNKDFELFDKLSRDVYKKNNKLVINNETPELFEEMIALIEDEAPDYVAFSLVYNSQCFYSQALVERLNKKYKILVGGPAVHHNLLKNSTFLCNEKELLRFFDDKIVPSEDFVVPDFSDFESKDYLTKELVYPLRTSVSCYYKQCAFCTHHFSQQYKEVPLELIKETILKHDIKNLYFFDDMISKKRLLELADLLKELKVRWWCQLKPTKDLLGIFEKLHDSGLRSVSWGIESGNQRILDLMKKGTKLEVISEVLKESHEAGIINLTYFILGFPTETKEELFDTIKFIEENKESIDLVSTSLFGLQRGSKVYLNPEEYGIDEIIEKKRTLLDDRILYKVKSGLQQSEVRLLRKKLEHKLHIADRIPRVYNFFKEQTIFCKG